MSTKTKFNLSEKLRQNWQSQYLFPNGNDYRVYPDSALQHNNIGLAANSAGLFHNMVTIDDSLTNLNWLQNLNLLSMPQCSSPLDPLSNSICPIETDDIIQTASTVNNHMKFVHPILESNSLYLEVSQNLEFMNEEASTHFFKVNNELRPPFSDINLISMAIYSYNKSKVSFPEICQWIEETFPYYKVNDNEWKVGIKNNLTLSKCFQKVPRRKNEFEKGSHWRFSNDFLGYLERKQLIVKSLNNIASNVQQENSLKIDNKYYKLISRKRAFSSTETEDEHENSVFKITSKRQNVCDDQKLSVLLEFDHIAESTLHCEDQNSLSLQSKEAEYRSICTSDQSSCIATSNVDNVQVPLVGSSDEQVTEQEFLSGHLLFNNTYLSTQSTNIKNIPTLLDSQVNFNNIDFAVHDLSITGVGIRPPEWWNQSLSKLSCSIRSFASDGYIERELSYTEEDHQTGWHSDQNLEELDILFGLS